MQSYTEVASTQTLTASRDLLLNNDKTVMSCSSGTAFPTTNLQVGMLCYRTDQSRLYQLTALTPTWKEIFDLTKTATNKEYVDAGMAAHGTQFFSTSGTFTVPDRVTTVWVTMSGGGGGGGAGSSYNDGETTIRTTGGTGGSGAKYYRKQLTVTPSQQITVTIGSGGNGGTSASATAGGTTSFGALASCAGGGYGTNASGSNGVAGASGSYSQPDHIDLGYKYGKGGSGGYGQQNGSAGTAGFVYVEW